MIPQTACLAIPWTTMTPMMSPTLDPWSTRWGRPNKERLLSDPNAFQHLRPNAGEEGVPLIGLTSSARRFGGRTSDLPRRRAVIALDSTDVGPQRVPRGIPLSFDSGSCLSRLCVAPTLRLPHLDALVNQTCEACRARAGRVRCTGSAPLTGRDRALDLVESRATPSGVTIHVYRPTGRPRYATATM
jgi:hypothetical protein